MEETFNVRPHDMLPDKMMVEYWRRGEFAADMARVESLRHHAVFIARATGKKIKLVRFTDREDLEEIG